MKIPLVCALAAGLCVSCAAARPQAGGQPAGRQVGYPQNPAISPDGSAIVFTFAGDLWSVSAAGGSARRITSHPAEEGRSAFSPDGTMLAFESDRDGGRSIYSMPVRPSALGKEFGDVRRVTIADRAHSLSAFSHDGTHVYFSSNHEPAIFRGVKMYRAPINADGPIRAITEAYGSGATPTPDGGIVFARGRFDPNRPRYVGAATTDLFRLDAGKGTFTQITGHVANDADGFVLGDGSIAFVSARDGQNNIWRIPAGKSDADAVQLTRFKPAAGEATIAHGVRDFNVAPGGSTGVFVVWDTLYTLDLTKANATPQAVRAIVEGDFSQVDYQRMNLSRQANDAALSPDGKTIAVIARGEIFLRSTEKDRPTRRVTDSHARERDLAWSADGKVLYFSSDETGVYGVYAASVALSREDLSPKKEKPEADAPKPAEDEAPKADEPKAEGAKEAKGDAGAEPPVAEAAKEGEAPSKPAKEEKPKEPDHGKRWSESLTFTIAPVVVGETSIRSPRPSPDGKSMLVTRGRGDLVLVNLEDLTQRVIFEGWDEPDVQWCSDSRHIIYSVNDVYFNADIWVHDTGNPEASPVNVTRHPDLDVSPWLSADGKVLYFLSDRDADSNGEFSLYTVNLDRKLDGLSTYELADYFKEAAENAKKRKPVGAEAKAPAAKKGKGDDAKKADEPAAGEGAKDADATKAAANDDAKPEVKEAKKPEPLKFDLDDAYLRVRRLVSNPGGVGDVACTPGGERVLYSASTDGATALFSVDYKGKEKKTVTTGAVNRLSFNLAGDKVIFVSAGEATIGKPTGGEAEKMSIDAPVIIEIEKQQKQKFLEAARLLGDGFYHPTLKGLDWSTLTKRYLSLAMRTRTDSEFNNVVNCLFGELDGSHLGIRGGRSTSGEQTPMSYLGVDAQPDAAGWKITRVLPMGPADRESSRLKVGEIITSIQGVPTAGEQGPTADLPVQLGQSSGRETLIGVRSAEGVDRLMLITPFSAGADSGLRYDAEVARRKAMVDRLSGGKLGYLHIRGMDIGSVRDFERDLYAAAHSKDALLIDVRDNGGGWTTDILLASLTAPRHAYTVPRGADQATMPRDAYPRDRRLIYHYNRPISVLINQNSYSNAEIFPHSIKTIGRGKLVGVATFGAVISTGAASLIDGTTVRMPFRGWYLLDDTDMENNGAQPDISVGMPPEAEVAGEDPQIEAAVRELMDRAAKEPFWDWKK